MLSRIFIGWKLGLQTSHSFVSFYKPSYVWSIIMSIITYLVWIFYGDFFTGKISSPVRHQHLSFLPHRYSCFSYPRWNTESENQFMRSKPSTLYRFVLVFFYTIAMLQQKASMSSQRNFDVVLPEDRVPPDKHHPPTTHMHDHLCSHNNIIQSNTISSFDTDSVPLYIDSCVTGGLTGFKSDFTLALFVRLNQPMLRLPLVQHLL